ncbi:MAG TPA: ATP-binding protein [Tepidisphaeraceae bacterium]|nr:ATP-binding protein [Tepidisphaeraceae bacterium]
MRRGPVLLFLCLLMLCGGIAALYTAPQIQIRGLHDVQLDRLICGSCFALAAVTGMMGIVSFRVAAFKLAKRVTALSVTDRTTLLDANHPDLAPLAFAINDLTEQARQFVDRAKLRVKELEIQLKVATAERQHAESIIYSISDAVLVTDPFDELVLANESAARTFDFDVAAASRKPVNQVLRDPKMIELIQEMRQSNSRSGRRIVEHQVRTPQGGRTFKVTLSCVSDGAAATPTALPGAVPQPVLPTGVVAVLHDMTKEKEVAEMKNDFVSSVSHELRTPLASIKAYVEMLIDGEATDDKTTAEFYEVIQNEANRLSRLIDNILNISQIESGLTKVNKQPLSLMVIIKEALEVISPQAANKNITLKEQLTPVFYQTLADRDMLYQAVLNLFSNAVKYTPEGGSITAETRVDEAKKIVITRISDTGVGIPPKDLPFLFDKFYRCEANNRMAKGTGLGLSLVKQIIEVVHKGRIFVESNVGKGSTFGFELKLAE